ncbi:hypothetical protein EYZ11_000242 [Aspergillus tanneri]|uniref:Uncharacterized protein n=1 Tax=Aspergillus tanneri TaxID=1220188 RepID=A0A4S3JXT2_9EURO|nr:hypothetical protein EYZ11_000242 [Aspergillus tanneri]
MTAQDEILDLVRRLESAPGVLAPLSIEAALHSRLLAAAQNLVASLKKPEIELRNLAKAVMTPIPEPGSQD